MPLLYALLLLLSEWVTYGVLALRCVDADKKPIACVSIGDMLMALLTC
jgi:hypothetical protein